MKVLMLLLVALAGLAGCTGEKKTVKNQTGPEMADTIAILDGKPIRIDAYVWVDLMPGMQKDEGGMNRPLHASITPQVDLTLSKEMIGKLWFVRGTDWYEVPTPGWNGKEVHTAAGPSWTWDKPVQVICSFLDDAGKTIYVKSQEVPVEKVY